MGWAEFEDGQTIFAETDKSDLMYQVVDGTIEIYTSKQFGEQKISKTILRGEMMGAGADREK